MEGCDKCTPSYIATSEREGRREQTSMSCIDCTKKRTETKEELTSSRRISAIFVTVESKKKRKKKSQS